MDKNLRNRPNNRITFSQAVSAVETKTTKALNGVISPARQCHARVHIRGTAADDREESCCFLHHMPSLICC